MYVDPELVDFNLQAANIDGVDCIVNYSHNVEKYENWNDQSSSLTTLQIGVNEGIINPNCFKYVHLRSTSGNHWCDFNYFKEYLLVSQSDYEGFTRTAWTKIEKSQYSYILCNYGGVDTHFDIPNKRFRFMPNGVDNQGRLSSWVTMSVVPPINEWFYCTVTSTPDGVVKMYINGQLSATATSTMTVHGAISLLAGAVFDSSSEANTVYFDDLVAVRSVLWDSDFTPPSGRLIENIDPNSFNIDMKIRNNLIAWPPVNRIKNILKVY